MATQHQRVEIIRSYGESTIADFQRFFVFSGMTVCPPHLVQAHQVKMAGGVILRIGQIHSMSRCFQDGRCVMYREGISLASQQLGIVEKGKDVVGILFQLLFQQFAGPPVLGLHLLPGQIISEMAESNRGARYRSAIRK